MADQLQACKEAIKITGKRLYSSGLAVARSGNISCRLDDAQVLITATGTYLGELSDQDIVRVDLAAGLCLDAKKPSSELPLHSLVYKNFPAKVVVHCHPPLANGYFSVNDSLEACTFETRFYLGRVPVVAQETPTVTRPEAVIDALKANSLVVLKHHGAVAMGETFDEAMALVEALEEAVKSACVARLFSVGGQLSAPANAAGSFSGARTGSGSGGMKMFSPEHIQAIVDLVNQDELIARKGSELDLTVQLAICLDGSDDKYKFNFEKGKIVRLDRDADAPFVISAPAAVWEQVFLGKLDSFVAVTQGKMSLKGQLGQLSKWYVPFTRLFELFKQVPIR
jgi:L-fuculose-phosphate aldolase